METEGQGFAKNQLMVLDILANFAWQRPIYFAITVGNDNFMGLEDYFQLEGLAYRFVPVKTSSLDGQTGIVATKQMYDNLIHKFKWGNMGDSDVYLDETNMRMTMNFFEIILHGLQMPILQKENLIKQKLYLIDASK